FNTDQLLKSGILSDLPLQSSRRTQNSAVFIGNGVRNQRIRTLIHFFAFKVTRTRFYKPIKGGAVVKPVTVTQRHGGIGAISAELVLSIGTKTKQIGFLNTNQIGKLGRAKVFLSSFFAA